MAERLRPVQMKFYVTEEEKNFIYKRMSLIGVKNLSAYLRKMAIDGQLVRIETRVAVLYVSLTVLNHYRSDTSVNHYIGK